MLWIDTTNAKEMLEGWVDSSARVGKSGIIGPRVVLVLGQVLPCNLYKWQATYLQYSKS